MTFAKDIGIDLGTASVLVYVKGKGVVLNEPSVVAMDKTTGKLLKVGTDAQAMLGRTPGNIIAIRPLREGVISDYDMTERMLKEFIHKVAGFSFFKPRVIICVPSGITEVEERAVIDAGIQAGARKVYLIEEPVAAAIGAGIDITQPDGHMVVDIGGGTADIAVISLSGVVESASIKIAGDQLNEAVVKYMRRKHNLLVGERTAEEMKKQIGCVFPKDEEETMDVKGRCLLTGLPKVVTVSSTEMMDAFEEPVERIMEAIHSVLERTPPELVADVSTNGIIMTGGGTADIAVISLSGVVESASIKIAGDQLNEAVVKYMRRKHNLLVGERTAEEMKKQIGCVFPKDEEETMDVKGRCLLTGLPKVVTVSSTEMMDAFEEPVERIMEAIHSVLERTPPELVADISTNGIVMTGGGSLVSGFDKLVTARTGIHTVIADDAISCVALGTGKSLDSLNAMQDGTMNLSRRKQMN